MRTNLEDLAMSLGAAGAATAARQAGLTLAALSVVVLCGCGREPTNTSAGSANAATPAPTTRADPTATLSPSSTAPTQPTTSTATPSVPAAPVSYRSYYDPRFGFRVSVPTSFTLIGPASGAGGDGETLRSTDASLQVFGQDNPQHLSAAQLLDQQLADARAAHIMVTYSVSNLTSYTLSGQAEGNVIIYRHAAVGPGSTNVVDWSYSDDERNTDGPLVTHTESTLKPGDLTTPQ